MSVARRTILNTSTKSVRITGIGSKLVLYLYSGLDSFYTLIKFLSFQNIEMASYIM